LPPFPAGQEEALKRVLAKSLVADGVRRGLHEAVKALAKATKGSDGAVPAGGARLAILAADCDEASYKKVVKALAQEKGVPLIEIPLAATLGEW
jgi:small subunit ribosomal protein S12e